MNTVLGVITARGGSKGIPRKNIKLLSGKPLIAYTIEAAKNSGIFDRIILSTDDAGIADVAKKFGCEVPFMRPAELAQDTTPHLPVMQHAVRFMEEKENYVPEYTAILQPTSPLRTAEHLKEAFEFLVKTGADSVLGVSEIPWHVTPYKAMMKNEKGFLRLMNGDPIWKRTARRQDLPQSYYSNGSIYIFKTNLLFDSENPSFYGENVVPYVMDAQYAVDVDTPEDWEEAEKMLKLTI